MSNNNNDPMNKPLELERFLKSLPKETEKLIPAKINSNREIKRKVTPLPGERSWIGIRRY